MIPTAIQSTTTLIDAGRSTWDVIVIGAGPAGAIASRELVRLGARVLLVDKAEFPRTKVCGCCLNGAALDALASIGLGKLPAQHGAKPLRQWRIHSRHGRAVCRLTSGYALSRTILDAALVEDAIRAGSFLLTSTQARVVSHAPDYVDVSLLQGESNVLARAAIVIAADGLAGQSLASSLQFQSTVQPAALCGAGAILADESKFYDDEAVVMACGPGGYVGLVRLEDGQLDVAAALDRTALKSAASPAVLSRHILESANLPVPPAIEASAWRGTPSLTRRRATLAADRVFVVGDAAGYTEPFTGEGLAWAMRGAIAVAPLARRAIEHWTCDVGHEWTQLHYALIGGTQFRSRMLGWLLRSRFGADLAVRALHHAPWLATPVIRAINHPRPLSTQQKP